MFLINSYSTKAEFWLTKLEIIKIYYKRIEIIKFNNAHIINNAKYD